MSVGSTCLQTSVVLFVALRKGFVAVVQSTGICSHFRGHWRIIRKILKERKHGGDMGIQMTLRIFMQLNKYTLIKIHIDYTKA